MFLSYEGDGGGISHQDLRYVHQQTFKFKVDFLFKEKNLVSSHPMPAQGNGECNSGPRQEQETGFARIGKILHIKIKIKKSKIYSRQNSKSTHYL